MPRHQKKKNTSAKEKKSIKSHHKYQIRDKIFRCPHQTLLQSQHFFHKFLGSEQMLNVHVEKIYKLKVFCWLDFIAMQNKFCLDTQMFLNLINNWGKICSMKPIYCKKSTILIFTPGKEHEFKINFEFVFCFLFVNNFNFYVFERCFPFLTKYFQSISIKIIFIKHHFQIW